MTSRVVLITGASAGFGRASAEHLGRLGHRVYGTSRRADFPEPAERRSSPLMIPMDVCEDESVQRAVDLVLKQEGRIDVVVNNAGVGLAGAVEDTSVEEAGALFETNLFGVLRVCHAVLPLIARAGLGSHREHQLAGRARDDPVPGLLLRLEVRPSSPCRTRCAWSFGPSGSS